MFKVIGYVFLGLLSLLLLALLGLKLSGKADMRTSQADFIQKLKDSGQTQAPQFETYTQAGHQMHYVQVGENKELPVLVFLHGCPGSSDAYSVYLSDTSLAKKAILISVDRAGYGFSDFGKTEPSLEKQANQLLPILEKYQSNKVILVGHSFGGPVAARTAMDYPNLVDGLVMIAPSISPELEPANWWRKIVDFPLIRWIIPTSFCVCNQEILPLKSELELMMPLWKNIKAKTVVIQGTKDNLVPADNANFAAEQLKGITEVKLEMVQDGDHFILWSEMDLIKNTLYSMMDEPTSKVQMAD